MRISGVFRRFWPKSDRCGSDRAVDPTRLWEEGEFEGKRGSFPSFRLRVGRNRSRNGGGGPRPAAASLAPERRGVRLATFRPSCEGRHEGVVPILDPPYPPILPHGWDVSGQGGVECNAGGETRWGQGAASRGCTNRPRGARPNPVWGPERVPPTTSYRARYTTASGLADRLPDRVGMRGGTARDGECQRGSAGVGGAQRLPPSGGPVLGV
jgi:hypothetical protein